MRKKNTKVLVYSQLSAALTNVQLKMYWTGPPSSFVTAARRLFRCKIAFIVWLSVTFDFCMIAFSSFKADDCCSVHVTQCAITSSQDNRPLGIFFETLFLISSVLKNIHSTYFKPLDYSVWAILCIREFRGDVNPTNWLWFSAFWHV